MLLADHDTIAKAALSIHATWGYHLHLVLTKGGGC
jgi:hypothetical protein